MTEAAEHTENEQWVHRLLRNNNRGIPLFFSFKEIILIYLENRQNKLIQL